MILKLILVQILNLKNDIKKVIDVRSNNVLNGILSFIGIKLIIMKIKLLKPAIIWN